MKGLLGRLLFFILVGMAPLSLQASALELSGSFSFSQNRYGPGNFEWTRRWGASLGYTFWGVSEIELGLQDVLYRTKIDLVEDTTFHDQIYSINWVQSFAGKNSGFQPYIKIGMGQLNRKASGSYAAGTQPPLFYDSLTVVLGLGLRIYILRTFAIRVEGTTYLEEGVLSSWQNNMAFNAGLSFFF